MMYKIMLACAAGMSTSMLVEKMKEAAKQQNIEVVIDAVSEGTAMKTVANYDVLLLGPQVSHLVRKFKPHCDELNIPVEAINMVDYGMMNGENVLNRAIQLIKGE